MTKTNEFLPKSFPTSFFADDCEKNMMLLLLEYITFDGDYSHRPEVSPKTGQAAVNLIREYSEPCVFSTTKDIIGFDAVIKYAVIYIEDHLSKNEIREVISDFFEKKGKVRLGQLLEQKLKINVINYMFKNKKHLVTKKDFEKKDYVFPLLDIFDYPRILEFDDDAFNKFAEDIYYGDTAGDTVEYFLAANNDLKGHDRWFYLCKHILLNTRDYDIFAAASKNLRLIRRTIDPDDEKTLSWMKDQIFEIFWHRVDGVWPILHRWELDENTILRDSVEWLISLDDLKKRLPDEVPGDFKLDIFDPKESEFRRIMDDYFKVLMKEKNPAASDIDRDLEYAAESAFGMKEAKEFEKFVSKTVIPAFKNKALQNKARKAIQEVLMRAEKVEAERENIKKIADHLKKWPSDVSPFSHPEFMNEIKLENIVTAECERDDPWYEYVSSPWTMKLSLLINGKKCSVSIYDQRLYNRYYDKIAGSGEFDLASEIPNQYGREVFTRKAL